MKKQKEISFALNNGVIDTPQKLEAIRKIFEGVEEYGKITNQNITYTGKNLECKDLIICPEKFVFDAFVAPYIKKS